jgi:DNA-binding response OmpR family regulator
MRILIAEDEAVSRRVLEAWLIKWGYEVVITAHGQGAWETLQRDDAPPLAILDVMMPEIDGIELCRRARQLERAIPTYIILLTASTTKEQVVAGLDAGADDYMTKPFDLDELRARVQAGARIVELQMSLAERLREREEALAQIKRLQGMLPMCSYCKSIRDDQNYWQRVESYIAEHAEVQFSHSICPSCYEKVVQPMLDEMKESMTRS